MRAKTLFLLVAFPLISTGIANAQPEGDRPDRPHRNPEMRQKMLEEFDADGDGKLNDEERQQARETMRERRGGPAGQDRPGRGGPQGRRGRGGEGRPDPNELFDEFDANGDGQLSREEFMKLTESQRGRRGGPGSGGGPGGPRADRAPRPDAPEGANRPRRPEGDGPPPRRADSEGPRLRDGADRAPLQNQVDGPARDGRGPRFGPGGPEGRPDPNEVFDRFDENGDDQLSREEFMKLTDSMRQRMSERGRRPSGPRGEGFGPPDRDRPGRPERPERPARPPRPESE